MATSSLRASSPRESSIDAALLVLRLTLGILILIHGLSKLPPPPAFIVDVVTKAGLPPLLAYGVYVGEILAPILLIVGVWTRLAALLILINMIVAVALEGLPHLLQLNKYGGYALEVEALFLFTALALALTGAGRYSIGGRYGPMN
jgi:putative oxidoreductase